MKKIFCLLFVLLGVAFIMPEKTEANGGEVHGKKTLHFLHAIIGESPMPDTKIRLAYFYRSLDEDGEKADEHNLGLELEYAFNPFFSVELGIPYTIIDPEEESSESNVNNIELGLKFANYAFSAQRLLLGYGIEFVLPTGNDEKGIGSSHIYEVEPFFSLGYKAGELELVGFVFFGIPFNQDKDEEIETELSYTFSALYPVSKNIKALLELDGETVLSGEEEGESVLNLSPGILLSPFNIHNIHIVLGASFPISNKKEFDYGINTSFFYHFN